jgi:hypothetical protein
MRLRGEIPSEAFIDSILRDDLYFYVQGIFPIVSPGAPFLPNWHIKAITHALTQVLRGEADGVSDIARAEGLCRTYVTRVLCLAFLAPEITRATLEGSHPKELTAKQLITSALDIPPLWSDQRELLNVRLTSDRGHP